MDESPSLEEFAKATSETDAEADAATEADADVVEPAVSTYSWSPSGAPCEACGATAERRWRDGEQFVCPACKDW
jgi:hypothetical protein